MKETLFEFQQGDLALKVFRTLHNDHAILKFSANQEALWIHWGLQSTKKGQWQQPPIELCPKSSRLWPGNAIQSPLSQQDDQGFFTTITIDELLKCNRDNYRYIGFVLYRELDQAWIKSGRDDFLLALEEDRSQQTLVEWNENLDPESWRKEQLGLHDESQLVWAVREQPQAIVLKIASSHATPLLLHWGVNWGRSRQWKCPAETLRPKGTQVVEETAVQSAFQSIAGISEITLNFPLKDADRLPDAISCVLFNPRDGTWLKPKRGDIRIPLKAPSEALQFDSVLLTSLAEQIVEAETARQSWTLMHRFNLAYELLEEAQNQPHALSLIFIWLRFSALRQLDWQRRYNTKPRELAHAQDRLTQKLGEIYRSDPSAHTWVRLMLSTLGHGGNGQRVRDEILEIMHRHHIKEAQGHFMEAWHQKLHNNTTPDDVVICKAYLAFLKDYGNAGRFYEVLEKNGVTKERLASFERPILTQPEFYADKRDGLIPDFEHYLRTLKAVHLGADLETAIRYALPFIGAGQEELYWRLLNSELPLQVRLDHILHLRREIKRRLEGADLAACRALLFLDLAVTEAFRRAVESCSLGQLTFDDLLGMLHAGMALLTFEENQTSYTACLAHLQHLLQQSERGRMWALELRGVGERLSGTIAHWSDSMASALQPKAEQLGNDLGIESWVLNLFAEEVIRGAPAFVVSLILKQLDPLVRNKAGIRGWQIISPGSAVGELMIVPSLQKIQERTFEKNTIILTDHVAGTEEIPAGVTSVITCDQPDLVSHVAVRARNAKVLLASCFDAETYEKLKLEAGHHLKLKVTPSGDVEYAEHDLRDVGAERPVAKVALHLSKRAFSHWVIAADTFNSERVGGKSHHLVALRRSLPNWIKTPASIALPFGCFEQTLLERANHEMARNIQQIQQSTPSNWSAREQQLRTLVNQLHAPPALHTELVQHWQKAHLPLLSWDVIWSTIKKVWASKWTERAMLARRARHIPDEDLYMAVLIQPIIAAEYAFVLHTVNPVTGDENQVFGELVLGLGETLVGNFPGRALGFTVDKKSENVQIVSYPSKNIGLYGESVIFRSDSNGEDLEEYAGAGLYDSVTAVPLQSRVLHYEQEALLQDEKQRDGMLRQLAKLGLAVENAAGRAQDIEGVVQQGSYYLVQTRPQVGL